MNKQARIAGNVMADSSPSGIEDFLMLKMKDVLANEMADIKIEPILKIQDYDDSLSGNVKNGFGAVVINVKGHQLYIPFIVKEKEFLPFDSIRMGDQQVAYEDKKLRKLVQALREVKSEVNESEDFETMVLGDTDHLPYDNGFLGTIMQTRDQAYQQSRRNGSGRHSVHSFGNAEEHDDLLRYASEKIDPLEVLEDVHEKIANIAISTEEDIEKVANEVRTRAIKEYDEVINAKQTARPDKTAERVKEMADQIELVEHTIVENGKSIEFPLVTATSQSRANGTLFKDLRRLSTIAGPNRKYGPNFSKGSVAVGHNKGFNSLIIDNKGVFKLIHDKDTVLVYKDKKLADNKLITAKAGVMKADRHNFYSLVLDPEKRKISAPFKVARDFKSAKEENGKIKSDYDLTRDGGTFFTSVQSTLFANVLLLDDSILGQENSFDNANILCVIAREGSGIDEGIFSFDELRKNIFDKAAHERDINVSMAMIKEVSYTNDDDRIIVVKPETGVIQFKGVGLQTVSDKKELFGFDKSAAFDSKSRIIIETSIADKEKPYSLKVEYAKPEGLEEIGGVVSKLEERDLGFVTEPVLRDTLSNLGIAHRQIDEAIKNTRRTTGKVHIPYRDHERLMAIEVARPDENAVKKFVQGVVNSTLNPANFKPVAEDVIADSITDIAQTILMHKVASTFDVAAEFEKIANEKRDVFHVELAAALNINHQLTKLAAEVLNGGYVHNAKEVYEAAEPLLKTASELATDVYYEFKHTNNELYKQANYELDNLVQQLHIGLGVFKKASVAKGIATLGKSVDSVKKKLTLPSTKEVQTLKGQQREGFKEMDGLVRQHQNKYPYGHKEGVGAELQGLEQNIQAKAQSLLDITKSLTESQLKDESIKRKAVLGLGVPATGVAFHEMYK